MEINLLQRYFTLLTVHTLLPNAPSNVTVGTVTSTSVALSWDAVLYREGIQNYKVYRNGTVVGSPTGTTFTDSTLTASTTYDYQVSAVGNDGVEGPKSAIVQATTTA
jgi:chitodextrinase